MPLDRLTLSMCGRSLAQAVWEPAVVLLSPSPGSSLEGGFLTNSSCMRGDGPRDLQESHAQTGTSSKTEHSWLGD